MKNKYFVFLFVMFLVLGFTSFVYAVSDTKVVPSIKTSILPPPGIMDFLTIGDVLSTKGDVISIALVIPPKVGEKKENSNPIIYTVDASKASFDRRDIPKASISDVLVGTRVAIEGVKTGTNIKATKVHIGNSIVKTATGEKVVNGGNNVNTVNGTTGEKLGFWQKVMNFFGKIFGKGK